MDDAIRDNSAGLCEGGIGAVERRHIIYLSGYDPRGAQGYFELFRRSCNRFRRLWPLFLNLQPLQIDSDEFAHWRMDLRGPNWQVETTYDFLRMEAFIRADMAGSTVWQALRALGWYAGDVVSGAHFLIFRAAWRFALHLLYFQLLALAWVAVAVAAGVLTGDALIRHFGFAAPASITAAVLISFAILFALRPLAQRSRLIQISACWTTLRRFGRGRQTWIDQVVESGAQHLIAAARENVADEIVLIGHSTGGLIAAAIMERALTLAPDLGACGPRLALLTLGSVMPAVALHPAACRMRAIVGKLATAKNLAWIDCQSRKDIMCFANFDPVDGIGVHVGQQRCNPQLWRVTFKDMIAPAAYNRFRWDHFRVHYQYILAGDRPAPYDYVLLVGGPMPIAQWPDHNHEFMAALLQDETRPGENGLGDTTVSTAL
jgi:hypothetical protein